MAQIMVNYGPNYGKGKVYKSIYDCQELEPNFLVAYSKMDGLENEVEVDKLRDSRGVRYLKYQPPLPFLKMKHNICY